MKHPDLRALARVAEEAGIDLRVLVLSRDAFDIALSTKVHRSLDRTDSKADSVYQAQVLSQNAAALAAQLKLIDPAFTMCLPYTSLGDAEWWSQQRCRGGHATAGLGLGAALPQRTRARWLHPQLDGNALNSMTENITLGGVKSEADQVAKDHFRTEAAVIDLAATVAYLDHTAHCC